MTDIALLAEQLKGYFADEIAIITTSRQVSARVGCSTPENPSLKSDYIGELTIEVPAAAVHKICTELRDAPEFRFEMLMDVCGVDYLTYGLDEWDKEDTTTIGFSRGVKPFHLKKLAATCSEQRRFAVVYHFLSIFHNHRLRLRTFAEGEPPMVDSVIDIWESANWYEREAFDLYGILFKGHPDLRRILTDYGFVGHPFRKDFPLIGHVEMRYDATLERCIYEPVSIQPRTLVPKVIRDDNRYLISEGKEDG
jgi:NADH-quinone oxidoreductase subunit C